jgi:recombination protein RecA
MSKELTNKDKQLKEFQDKINKDFGEGTMMSLKDLPLERESISTGSLGLDLALGIGGLPKGTVVEIYGPESSGKTTIAIHILAEAQKKGGKCLIIDAEHAFDKQYAENLGVNTNELLISQPDYGEQALEVAEKTISSGLVDVVVIDSVAALVPKGELEGEMGESKMGLQARMMSQALRKLTGTVYKNNVLCIFINQLRDKIGVTFGNPETTTGGNALKFYASVRLDVRRSLADGNKVKDGELTIGNSTSVRVIKNKVAPPFKKATFDIIYGHGIDRYGEIVDIGSEWGIIHKSGSWYSYGIDKVKLGQGKQAVIALLKDNPEVALEIEEKIKNYGK